MSDAYDLALARFRQTGPFYGRFGDGPGFANHGPMVAEALDQLGRDADVEEWTARYLPLLRPRPVASGPIQADGWQAALGDWHREGDWLAFFERAVGEAEWHDVVRTWLGRLMCGPDLLGHGPIRLFHVVRALEERVTPARLAELGDALAYWAMAYDPTFVSDAPGVDADFDAVFDRVFLESAWAYMAKPDYRPIVLTHAMTAPRAIRELLGYLPLDSRRDAVRVAVSLSRQIRAPYLAPLPELRDTGQSRDSLVDQCVASGDDHAIKLTEACLRQYARDPQPVFLAVADDISRRLKLMPVSAV